VRSHPGFASHDFGNSLSLSGFAFPHLLNKEVLWRSQEVVCVESMYHSAWHMVKGSEHGSHGDEGENRRRGQTHPDPFQLPPCSPLFAVHPMHMIHSTNSSRWGGWAGEGYRTKEASVPGIYICFQITSHLRIGERSAVRIPGPVRSIRDKVLFVTQFPI
jgi:hypothetical protein